MDAITRQRHLEEEMQDLGVQRFRNAWNASRSRNDVGRHTAVRELIANQIDPTAKLIRDAVERATSGRAGRRNAVIGYIQQVEPEVLAYLTARCVMNGLIVNQAYGTIQRELGMAVEDELRIQRLATHDQSAVDWVERETKRRGVQARHMQRRYYLRMEALRGTTHKPWASADRIKVGAALIELFCAATRVCSVVHKRTGKKTKAILQPIPQVLHWVSARNDQLELLCPDLLPMVVPPKAWTSLDDGGYLGYRTTLVKNLDDGCRQEHWAALERADLTEVKAAVHTLDCTPYRVNGQVYAVMVDLMQHGHALPGLEKTDLRDLPEKPEDAPKGDQRWLDYRKQAREVHDHNNSATSTRLQFERCLSLAAKFMDAPSLYFPNTLDFRGRVYPLPATLNPQGPDFARALLHFRDSKQLGDTGWKWLKINLANLYGEDKVSLDERVLWAEEHKEQICDVAHNPHGQFAEWWKAADKPWQFLAACIDYHNALQTGYSNVRVSMDGSCNGIQHFAAMLRDPIAARAVNLTPSEAPRDIYQDVADVVVSHLKGERDPQKKFWADQFLVLGVDRKITKRSVMVMPYGGTFKSTMNYVMEECVDRGYQEAFGEDWLQAGGYLAKLVYDGTREVVKGGADVMAWLQKVATLANKTGVHLRWSTPTGFVAEQHYLKHVQSVVKTKLDGVIIRNTADYTPTDKIDGAKSKNGISPNYVHSMDAAAMMKAVNRARARGVTSFHCIHDDFGTHAGDTEVLFHELRQAFVEIYRVDVLVGLRNEFRGQIPEFLPELPEKGTFDINDVLMSEYFFC